MKSADLLIAANTVWVVVAAVLVMFMQAGFAFLEAGLTRMKNAGHIAAKNVLIFGICSLLYWAVGFGLAFGDGNAVIGTSGFFPSCRRALCDRRRRRSASSRRSRRAPATCSKSSSRASRSRSSGARWQSARSSGSTSPSASSSPLIYSVMSHWIWHSGGWLFGLGMQDFAGSTVVHYQGALAALAGALLLGPQDRQVRHRRQGKPDPGPQHALRRARHDHPLVRLVRLQPRLDARRGHRRQDRLLRLRRPDDEPRRRGGRARGHRHRLGRAQEAGHLDDAERRHRRARRHHRRLGLRRPVGRSRDRLRRRRDRGRRRPLRRADPASTTRSARSRCTAWQASGARSRPASSPFPPSPRTSPRARAGSSTRAASTSSASRRSASSRSAHSPSARRSRRSGR